VEPHAKQQVTCTEDPSCTGFLNLFPSSKQTIHNTKYSAKKTTTMASETAAPALDTSTSAAVDESPISPTRAGPERRNSLEKRLAQRPDVQDLKNRNILLDTNAAP
jgi:hypothetical protein